MQKFKNLLLRLVIPTITLILVTQLIIMTREITWQAIWSSINDVAWWQAALLILLGFLAVIPTLYNDQILSLWQGYQLTNGELLQRSWLVNVINLNVGFFGVLSVLLRRIFYSDQTRKNGVKPFVQMYFLGQTGLLLLAVLVLFDLLVWHSHYFADEIGWLAVLIIVGMAALAVSLSSRLKAWDGLTWPVAGKLMLNAVVTVSAQMILFLIIGIIINVQLSWLNILIVFVIASTIALISMAPGTWGAFEVAVLLLISLLGVSRVDGVIWLILYRVTFNLVPLLSALGLLFFRLSKQINNNFRGVPHYVAQAVVHRLVTIALYLSGILLVLSGTMPQIVERIPLFNQLRLWPITYALANQLPSILLGFLILMNARGVANRVARAYQSTIIVLSLTVVYVLFFYRHLLPLILIGLVLMAVIFSKKTLYRSQFIHAWEEQTVDGVIWGALIAGYLMLGFMHVPSIHRHFIHVGHLPSIHWWWLGAVTIAIVAISVWLLAQFLHAKQRPLGTEFDEMRVQEVLSLGDNHYTSLIFLGDKRLYFYQIKEHDVVGLQFRLVNNKAMVMGDPFGESRYFAEAMQAFVEEADRLGYVPVFYEVSERVAMLAHEFGYDFFKLGEEAHVNLADFSTAGKKMQNIRSEMNQAGRAGFEFKVLTPPFSPEVIAQMQTISDEWLAGRDEKGYSLGFFDPNYLQRGEVAILEKDDRIEAFASLVVSHTEKQMAVDLMRFTASAPNGVMDVLFVNAFKYAKSQNYETFNLGMSPLANVGLHRQSFGRERLANLVYQFGSKVYSFEGLHHYKNKFSPTWQAMYIAYSRKSSIIAVMIGLLKVDNKGVAHAPEIDLRYTKDNLDEEDN